MYVSQKLYTSRESTSQHVFVAHHHQVNTPGVIFRLCVAILDLLSRVVKNLWRFLSSEEHFLGKKLKVFYRYSMTLAGLFCTLQKNQNNKPGEMTA